MIRAPDVDPTDTDLTVQLCGGGSEAEERQTKNALARALLADKAENFARSHLKRDASNGLHRGTCPLEADVQVVQSYHWRAGTLVLAQREITLTCTLADVAAEDSAHRNSPVLRARSFITTRSAGRQQLG